MVGKKAAKKAVWTEQLLVVSWVDGTAAPTAPRRAVHSVDPKVAPSVEMTVGSSEPPMAEKRARP